MTGQRHVRAHFWQALCAGLRCRAQDDKQERGLLMQDVVAAAVTSGGAPLWLVVLVIVAIGIMAVLVVRKRMK